MEDTNRFDHYFNNFEENDQRNVGVGTVVYLLYPEKFHNVYQHGNRWDEFPAQGLLVVEISRITSHFRHSFNANFHYNVILFLNNLAVSKLKRFVPTPENVELYAVFLVYQYSKIGITGIWQTN